MWFDYYFMLLVRTDYEKENEITTHIDRKFYDFSKGERTKLVGELEQEIKEDSECENSENIRR